MPTNEIVAIPSQRPVERAQSFSHSFDDLVRLADAVAKSGMFGIKTREQALVLMEIARAEGRHPAEAARDYNIIQGRPSKTAEAMLRDFLQAGGRVEWHGLSDDVADATFSHPFGGKIRILWDQARVKQAGLSGREMHQKYPRQMLRSRCVSEGVKTVYPLATSGFYTPEEVRDMPAVFTDAVPVVTDATAALDEFAAAEPEPPRDILAEARSAARGGTAAFRAFWLTLSGYERDQIRDYLSEFQAAAATADDPFGLPPPASEAGMRASPAETPAPAPRRARSAPAAPPDLGEIAVPVKANKPDYRTWAVALFLPKVRACTNSNDLADLLGANEAHLEQARAPGAMPAADLVEMERVIADQWMVMPPDAIITDGLTQAGRI